MHHNWQKQQQQLAHQNGAQGWSGPVRGKECSSWRRRTWSRNITELHPISLGRFLSSRTCQLTSRALFGPCWWSGHTSVWVSSGDSLPVLGHPGIWVVTSYSMAGIMRPWCRTFCWNGWTWTTGSFSPAGNPNRWLGLRISKDVSLGWTMCKHDIQWRFLVIYDVYLCRYLFPGIAFRLILHWLFTSCQLSSCCQQAADGALSAEQTVKVSPLQFINFCMSTEDDKIHLQLIFLVFCNEKNIPYQNYSRELFLGNDPTKI